MDDLQKEWSQHDKKKEGKHHLVTESPVVLKKENSKNQQPLCISVLEPLLCPVDMMDATMPQGSKDKRTVSSPRPSHNGPWSLDWLSQVPIQEGGKVFTAGNSAGAKQHSISKVIHEQPLQSKHSSKKTTVRSFKHSMGFLKRVVRMPSVDRK